MYRDSRNASKYGIIRALNEEAQKIAKEREEMFARDHTLDPVWQRMKHYSVRLMKEEAAAAGARTEVKKSYRIRNILKEKRETIAEFVNKKREIFLSNMNISIKREETQRLEDFIKNEQESLRARQLVSEAEFKFYYSHTVLQERLRAGAEIHEGGQELGG